MAKKKISGMFGPGVDELKPGLWRWRYRPSDSNPYTGYADTGYEAQVACIEAIHEHKVRGPASQVGGGTLHLATC